MKKKMNLEQLGILIVMIVLFIFIALPVWSAFLVSFMTDSDSLVGSGKLWTDEWSLSGYKTLFSRGTLTRPFFNTVYTTVVGAIIHMFTVSLAAYALVQQKLPGKRAITLFFLLTMMVPAEAIMIPRFVMFKELNLTNNLNALILISMASGFSIMLLENFFKSVPESFSESARIDGASEFRIFYDIYLPLAKNGLLVVLLFYVVGAWNQYADALILINDTSKYVIQQAIKGIVLPGSSGGAPTDLIYPNLQMAAVVVAIMPILILYAFFQNISYKALTLVAKKVKI